MVRSEARVSPETNAWLQEIPHASLSWRSSERVRLLIGTSSSLAERLRVWQRKENFFFLSDWLSLIWLVMRSGQNWLCPSNKAVFTGSCGPKEEKCIGNEGIFFSLEHIGPAIATFRAQYTLMLLIRTVWIWWIACQSGSALCNNDPIIANRAPELSCPLPSWLSGLEGFFFPSFSLCIERF